MSRRTFLRSQLSCILTRLDTATVQNQVSYPSIRLVQEFLALELIHIIVFAFWWLHKPSQSWSLQLPPNSMCGFSNELHIPLNFQQLKFGKLRTLLSDWPTTLQSHLKVTLCNATNACTLFPLEFSMTRSLKMKPRSSN